MRQSFDMRNQVAEYAVQIRQHVVVPVADDGDALFSEPLRSAIVSLLALLGMLPTIHLNGEMQARTVEVDGVRADRVLLSERKAVELITKQRAPEARLCIGHVDAKGARAGGHIFRAGKA